MRRSSGDIEVIEASAEPREKMTPFLSFSHPFCYDFATEISIVSPEISVGGQMDFCALSPKILDSKKTCQGLT